MFRTAITALALVALFSCSGTRSGDDSTDPGAGADADAGAGDSAGDLSTSDDAGASATDLATGMPANGALTPSQKAVAEAMTSIWENDTPILDYAYAENIKDGRGYTSGRAGFCTGTGDAIQVVDCYDKLRTAANGNLMAKYMPALTTINNERDHRRRQHGHRERVAAEVPRAAARPAGRRRDVEDVGRSRRRLREGAA
jgi:chitosanase